MKTTDLKKYIAAVGLCLLMAVGVQATVIASLDLPGSGSYSNATVVTTAQTSLGATFDIAYTVEATEVGEASSNVLAVSNGSILGVRSVADGTITGHYTTLEGIDEERLSFTALSIVNFNAGASGLTVGDITGLRFTGITVSSVANNQDGVTISFTDFATDTEQVHLNGAGTGGTNVFTIALTDLTNYSSPETDLYIQPDNLASANRWSVSGLGVEYTVIPEPSALALLGLGGVALFVTRRKRRRI